MYACCSRETFQMKDGIKEEEENENLASAPESEGTPEDYLIVFFILPYRLGIIRISDKGRILNFISSQILEIWP